MAVVMPVVVMVAVGVRPRMREPLSEASQEDRRTDPDHEQPRDEVQPGVELLGDDELRERERDEAEREDADRVRDGHDQAEVGGVPGPEPGTSRADAEVMSSGLWSRFFG